MPAKSISVDNELARKIKERRVELELTIEEAAARAGVGTKSWYRYEAGESIREDKWKGICKALNWKKGYSTNKNKNAEAALQEYKNHDAWSPYLEKTFGIGAALSFALGSDILLDHINEDLSEISSMPAGTHIGQLGFSWLRDELPQQFLLKYDYDFLYRAKCTLQDMRKRARDGHDMIAHSVLEELLIYLSNEEMIGLIELDDELQDMICSGECDSDEWVFELFDDMDLGTCLYSDCIIDDRHVYHFSHWIEKQFFIEENDGGSETG